MKFEQMVTGFSVSSDIEKLRPLLTYLQRNRDNPAAFASVDDALKYCLPENRPFLKNEFGAALTYLVKHWGQQTINTSSPQIGYLQSASTPISNNNNSSQSTGSTSQPSNATGRTVVPGNINIMLGNRAAPTTLTTPQISGNVLQTNSNFGSVNPVLASLPVPTSLTTVQASTQVQVSQPSVTPLSDLLADQGHGQMTGDAEALFVSKWAELYAMANYAVGDASRFGGDAPAKAAEEELYGTPNRRVALLAANQAAGGRKHYKQVDLQSVYTLVCKAEGGICTTFALAVAHVLTGGQRQTGNVRVEIIGVDRGMGTHMFVVCGRRGNTLAQIASWGTGAIIIDLWHACLKRDIKHYRVGVTKDDWRLQDKLGQYYDNARADPADQDLASNVNVNTLAANLSSNELIRMEAELARMKKEQPFAKVKIAELEQKINAAKKN